MTDRERKDYYLGRIRRTVDRYKNFPNIMISRLEEELKIIMWNNDEDWTEQFMNDEVVPLLNKCGVKVKNGRNKIF